MKKTTSLLCGAISASALFLAAAATSHAQTGYAINSSGNLLSFNVNTPSVATTIGPVGVTLNGGIDFRADTGTLFGLSVGANGGQLYTVSLTTGAATPVGAVIPLTGTGTGGSTGTTTTTYTLSATAGYGFDINPKTRQGDGSIRIRVVSTNGADLRLNSATGAVAAVDPTLNFASGAGSGTPSIVGAAYTNNVVETAGTAGIGTTTLYDVSDTTNSLYTQTPPNDGTLTAPFVLMLSTTVIDVQAATGFDIFTAANGTNTAYLATDGDAQLGSELYTVNLNNGAAALLGTFSGASILDIAILPVAVPEPGTYALCGMGLTALAFGWMRRRSTVGASL